MKKTYVLISIVIVIVIIIAGFYVIRNFRTQRIKAYIDNVGWIPMREPFISQSYDYYNNPENWKETEQLIGQTSLKFFNKNHFVCEWEPINKIKDLIWILVNCAEVHEDRVEKRAQYIIFKVGDTGNIESFYIPVGSDYSELIIFSGKNPEQKNMLSETRLDHLNMRLSSNEDIPPLAFERNGLLE